MPDQQFDRCARCGALKSAHTRLDLLISNTPGDYLLLCPRSTYQSPSEAQAETRQMTEADAELQKLMEDAG